MIIVRVPNRRLALVVAVAAIVVLCVVVANVVARNVVHRGTIDGEVRRLVEVAHW